ncbi:MAG: ATP-binding protein [Proteobacteria bacterium]|nr:ATP-binding protein [Pseudomonadota bacterium]MDA1058710.1 ATP-binding protein [Pseudomonadota bacterium]
MLKRMLPKTLLGRSIAIVVAPVVFLQIILAIVFFDNHWDSVTRRLSLGIAGDISMVIRLLDGANEAKKAEVLGLARTYLDLDAAVIPQEVLPPSITRNQPVFNIPDRMLHRALGERLFRPYAIDTANFGDRVQILVQLPEGVLRILTSRKRLDSTTTTIFVLWMVGSSLILLGIAIVFLRNQMRPIYRLADMADALGKGREVADVRPSGATEIRLATRAFMAMRDRLRRSVEQRTEMLAGVSHDLRTPLTRVKLELALVGNQIDVSNIESDIRSMEQMIEEYLSFARGQDVERPVNTDIAALLREVTDEAHRQGHSVALHTGDNLAIPIRPNAFKRCLTNLIENAMHYAVSGTDAPPRVEIAAIRHPAFVEITVDDSGPGIAAEYRDEAFKAFSRLDSARRSDTAGVGLGLTIARDVARSHGGDLTLHDSPLGGLRALIRLPV